MQVAKVAMSVTTMRMRMRTSHILRGTLESDGEGEEDNS